MSDHDFCPDADQRIPATRDELLAVGVDPDRPDRRALLRRGAILTVGAIGALIGMKATHADAATCTVIYREVACMPGINCKYSGSAYPCNQYTGYLACRYLYNCNGTYFWQWKTCGATCSFFP